jgi:hypothetical protein
LQRSTSTGLGLDFISKVAKTEKEVCSLIEVGFEYVTDFEGAKIFRKKETLACKTKTHRHGGAPLSFAYKGAGGGI